MILLTDDVLKFLLNDFYGLEYPSVHKPKQGLSSDTRVVESKSNKFITKVVGNNLYIG